MSLLNEIGFAKTQVRNLFVTKGTTTNLSFTTLLTKIEHHLHEIEAGHDFEKDGILHSAYVQYYSSLLTQSYATHPQGDDRKHFYLNVPNIGLDIDEVLCDWVGGWMKLYNMERPTSWSFDRLIGKRFDDMKKDGTLDNFYLSLDPKVKGSELPFEPICYITSRPVDTAITEQWLHMHGFPSKPVHTVPVNHSKIAVAREAKVEIFIDDGWHNFKEFNKAGICCYLYDAPHNRKYNVGHKRIKTLHELPCLFHK
jgi:5'(3')-deoxyribonucleotidase